MLPGWHTGLLSSATFPGQFQVDDWAVTDEATGGDITISIISLPGDGGSMIVDIQYQIDGGPWISLGDYTVGDYLISGLTDNVEIDVAVRAVNAVGPGPGSAAKTVTPTPLPAGFYALVIKDSNQVSGGVVTWETEVADSAAVHDTVTNNSRFTIPADWNGRYIRLWGNFIGDASSMRVWTLKNGATFPGWALGQWPVVASSSEGGSIVSAPVLAATGNYFEFTSTFTGLIGDAGAAWTWGQIELMPSDFSGALAGKTVAQTVGAGTSVTVTFDTETYDTAAYHDNSTNNDRLTVPSGVSLVRLTANVHLATQATALMVTISKNGAGAYGMPRSLMADAIGVSVCSAPIAVSAGDYFQMSVFNSSASSRSISTDTTFSIQALPSDLKYALVRRASNQALSSTPSIINWTTDVVDVGDWHDTSSNTSRLVVPSGVSKVRVGFNFRTEGTHTGWVTSRVLKNGTEFAGMQSIRTDSNSSVEDALGGWSGIIEVVPGDYFEVELATLASSNLGTGTLSWFAIEEVRDTTP